MSFRCFLGFTFLAGAPFLENGSEKLAGVAARCLDDILRRTPRNDFTAAIAAFRAEIDHPVRGLDDFEIVLDHDNAVSLSDQFMQDLEQLGDIVKMQSGRRLVENVERAAGRALAEFFCEFDALRFAAG